MNHLPLGGPEGDRLEEHDNRQTQQTQRAKEAEKAHEGILYWGLDRLDAMIREA